MTSHAFGERASLDPEALVAAILGSPDRASLGLAPELNLAEVKVALAELETNDGWRAYDLVHNLDVFGRAW